MKHVAVTRSQAGDQWFVREDGLIIRVCYSKEEADKEAKAYKRKREDMQSMIEGQENAKS